ncbi:MAG: protein phosphatase 2C domain-containing protein [Verrucomicrobia bacterium]|nr:MAG: protein phosphatase 2C domain-containing protein [Verrucomicrobiota bacterium]
MSQPAWVTIAATVAGRRHRRQQVAGQDVLRTAVIAERWLVVALADGAGSAPRGGLGADLATRAALGTMARHCADRERRGSWTAAREALAEALQAARRALEEEAAREGHPPGHLATTLLVVLAAPEGVAAAQIGDGAVVHGNAREEEWACLTRPMAGEYLNETVFLTSEGALDRAQIEHREQPVRELAVFSDGLQMLALDMTKAAPHPPFFRPMFAWLARAGDPVQAGRELQAFLSSPRVTERTDDDVSLCLARWTG